MTTPPEPLKEETDYVPYEDDEVEPVQMPTDEDPVDCQGCAIGEQLVFDRLIHAELTLPQGEEMRHAKVLRRSRDADGSIVGTYDKNPILNTIVYDVEFPDGAVKQYAANTIAENMYAQVDSEGFRYNLFDEIIDYGTDEKAVKKGDKYTITRKGRRRQSMTTGGWKLLIR